jgi:N-acetylglucosamine kinase
MSREVVLGLDGGGSKTFAIAVDRAGTVVSVARGEGINPMDQPNWRSEFRRVLKQFGREWDDVKFGAFGIPGYGEIETLSSQQLDEIQAAVSFPCLVENDVRVAYDGAFLSDPGVLLLAGTGSMAWASDSRKHYRIGGWGDGFGDEGSAYWIGREALGIASRHLDHRIDATDFCAGLLAKLDIDPGSACNALMDRVYGRNHPRSSIAAVARKVDELADAGDRVAHQLLDQAADMLALHVTTATRLAGEDLPWAFVGGVSASQAMVHKLSHRLKQAPRACRLPPVGGAAWRAACAAGWNPDGTWVGRLSEALSHQ